jgi:carbamoyltransferase
VADVIGVSCFYHDSSACLVRDGKVIAAAQEERFSRRKNTDAFPIEALNYCSQFGNVLFEDVQAIGYFEKPYLKFSRVLIEHLNQFPFSLRSFLRSMPHWMQDRLLLPLIIEEELSTTSPVHFLKHHLSHAASAFLPSPFEQAAIMTCDGVGEWATMSVGKGEGSRIAIEKEICYPDSLGLLYTTFTVYLGFHAHGGEGKTMGLAGYGEPRFKKELEEVIHIFDDGSFRLNQKYFSYRRGQKMWNRNFERLFGPPRKHGEPWTQRHYDIAASLQDAVERVFILAARSLHKKTGSKNLCLAGGVTLNCVANAKLLGHTDFTNIFVQPAAGDAGGAIGSALYISNSLLNEPRHHMNHSFLGPEFSEYEILRAIKNHQIERYERLDDDALVEKAARHIHADKTLGWFQGRMEFGPRALGGRSILANPCSDKMKDILNSRIKKRESFRPFAPMVLKERCHEFFELEIDSPYMLLAPKVRAEKQALLPAITHADGTARVQTVGQDEHPLLRKLIERFEPLSGAPVLLNTSFNRNGEPVVCKPEHALDCFLNTELDALAIGPYWIEKS